MYKLQEGVLTCTLPTGSVISQSFHPQTNEPVTEINAREVLKACISADQWDALCKLEGIEFEGVMCSATKDDQSGVMAVLMTYQMQGDGFTPTRFEFSNGNALVLTKTNMMAFAGVWMPFRKRFFMPN
jgi:hypothetical protein